MLARIRSLVQTECSDLCSHLETEDGAIRYTKSTITGKKLGLLWWRAAPGRRTRRTGAHVDLLVIGDSYADDI